jgi:quinohemoprotein ethanol dehydrogenase
MRIQLWSSSQFSFPMSMSKCAIVLFCSAFLFHPLFAQTLNWAYYGNDVSNSRYADIDQINPSNVSQLKPAWIFHTGIFDPAMAMEMTPIVINGVMYITTGDDDVYALNAATGKQIWAYHPTDMVKISTLPVCCNNDNRGVAVGGGLVFDARLDANLVALNASTGKVIWTTAVDSPANGATMTLAPQYISASSGTVPEVLVGVSGAEFGARGHLDAYNPATGKLLWRFWTTTPATYAGTSWQQGGATVWGTPTFDPTLNMVYFSTGNAYPWPYAATRAGTNLYAASIVALDATSGELQWFFQEVHHDVWDYDGPQPTVLFSWNGIPALEHTNKTGYVWLLDRASGEPLSPYDEVAVPPTPADAAFEKPWPTQPQSSIESLTEQLVNQALPASYTYAPMWTVPQPQPKATRFETVEWSPAAYSPRTNMLYSHTRSWLNNFGVSNADAATDPNCQPNHTTLACGIEFVGIPAAVRNGFYGAVNTVTGKLAWTIPILTTTPDSGMTVAGDLVFFGDSTGIFYGVSAATGQILWVFDANTVPNAGGANGSAAVYEVGGVEYIVYGFGGNPGDSFLLGDAVVAFALPSAVAAADKKAALAEKSLAQRGRVR